jgi:UDP-N-acetylmuramoyl-L-alanyl-D-glutamate--2,6-diaminopimelate ligase
MEVSSHSLELKRVHNLHFSEALFTNITSDHLDFHGSFESYFKAKKILFDNLAPESFVICNADDNHGRSIVKDSKAKVFYYGTSSYTDFRMKDIQFDLSGTSFEILYNKNKYIVSTSLAGEFNAYNACAAFAGSVLMGINEEEASIGIRTTKHVPGRFEIITNGNKKVIIDYSHTADSLRKALEAIKKINKDNNPDYTVFGCGGNRDKTKRPVMGKIASELSSKVFVTSDNPRFEDPLSIINEIKNGISGNNFEIVENREEAIKKAIEDTESGAVILIAGKGHENYQEIKGIRNHFSDKETAQKYLFK